ncbi:hypothetical protein AB6A40_001582 [Gnathostoma spinigerum]|uniref:Uncharacterized protein n=1 Tax=Gnathostoma spinigerum TaxID=75299 RepID=A0ABD6E4H5_9BILA
MQAIIIELIFRTMMDQAQAEFLITRTPVFTFSFGMPPYVKKSRATRRRQREQALALICGHLVKRRNLKIAWPAETMKG